MLALQAAPSQRRPRPEPSSDSEGVLGPSAALQVQCRHPAASEPLRRVRPPVRPTRASRFGSGVRQRGSRVGRWACAPRYDLARQIAPAGPARRSPHMSPSCGHRRDRDVLSRGASHTGKSRGSDRPRGTLLTAPRDGRRSTVRSRHAGDDWDSFSQAAARSAYSVENRNAPPGCRAAVASLPTCLASAGDTAGYPSHPWDPARTLEPFVSRTVVECARSQTLRYERSRGCWSRPPAAAAHARSAARALTTLRIDMRWFGDDS